MARAWKARGCKPSRVRISPPPLWKEFIELSMEIIIRPQRISDAKRYYEILTQGDFWYLNIRLRSIADEIKFLKQNAQKRRKNLEHNYAIVAAGKVIGSCGIHVDQYRKYIGEIGYFVAEEFWGKGIATQAVRHMEEIGFGRLKLKRIQIIMDPRNKASERVARKAGYKKEGRMRKFAAGRDGILRERYLYAKVK